MCDGLADRVESMKNQRSTRACIGGFGPDAVPAVQAGIF